jgi:hypothetical protein
MPGVPRAGVIGHQRFDGLAEQFFAREAEQLFGYGVQSEDASVAVGLDDGVGGGFEEGAETPIGTRLGEGLLGLFHEALDFPFRAALPGVVGDDGDCTFPPGGCPGLDVDRRAIVPREPHRGVMGGMLE